MPSIYLLCAAVALSPLRTTFRERPTDLREVTTRSIAVATVDAIGFADNSSIRSDYETQSGHVSGPVAALLEIASDNVKHFPSGRVWWMDVILPVVASIPLWVAPMFLKEQISCAQPPPVEDIGSRWRGVVLLMQVGRLLLFMNFSLSIVHAFRLAEELGRDSVWSGWLIGSFWLACPFAASYASVISSPWQNHTRSFILLQHAGRVLADFLTALVLLPILEMGPELRVFLVLASRVAAGACADAASFGQNIACWLTAPPEHMVQVEIQNILFTVAGIGLGPLVCAFVGWHMPGVSKATQAGATMGVFSAVCLGYLVVLWRSMPSDQTFVRLCEQRRTMSAAETDAMYSWLSLGDRKMVFVLGCSVGVVRAFLVGSLESASAYLLEGHLQLSMHYTGCVVGCTYLAAVPVILLSNAVRNGTLSRDMAVLGTLAVLACLSTFLMRTSAGQVITSPEGAIIAIGAADCLTFAFAYTASAIANAMAINARMEGTMYNLATVAIVDCVLQNGVARYLAPVSARATLSSHGQDGYAISLLFAALCLALGSIFLCKYLSQRPKDRAESI